MQNAPTLGMANRPSGFGLSKELQDKLQRFDLQIAEEIFSWFVELEISESPSQLDETSFQSLLKDGKILCNLALKLPGLCHGGVGESPLKHPQKITLNHPFTPSFEKATPI